jgi:hypothetical protein
MKTLVINGKEVAWDKPTINYNEIKDLGNIDVVVADQYDVWLCKIGEKDDKLMEKGKDYDLSKMEGYSFITTFKSINNS